MIEGYNFYVSQMLLGLLLPQPRRCSKAAAYSIYAEWPHVFRDTQENDPAHRLWHGTLSVPRVTPLACCTIGMTGIPFLTSRRICIFL